MKTTFIIFMSTFWLLPISLFAHGGHGVDSEGILHYLTATEHFSFGGLLLFVLAFLFINKYLKNQHHA